ncbi:PREDICTED: fasciclin-like arabinogalactan protein 21 [Nelumbo nucifera]|uniref:FAS1 domain-containing protein n=2 Tax=Nelumbo nucifera TaxID=4432 RepID=A0A822YUW1_NELNU|nr:PREDICTED: fasciclin-like arabinogalactan protein 21 [Nelumbo nucifera]DAD35883.1 TPA_asm: hypothetical protein HUJ06_006523 [Nelumbo nucifera]
MDTRLQLTVLLLSVLASFSFSRTSFAAGEETPSLPLSSPPSSPLLSQEIQESFTLTTLLEPILANLGFHELAMAVPSLSDSAFTTWNGPSTLFAPTDASIRSCGSCSVPRLLREHIVPGIFSLDYMRKLAFGTKIETMSSGRCITVTSADNNSKIFVGGVEITQPDIFNNGIIVVHGLNGFVAPLSPFSCNVERMTSLSFPPQPSAPERTQYFTQSPVMRLMLRDAMLRLRNNGFSVLSLAMRVKYAELVNLQNMTIFTLDDMSIFSGGHAYVSNVRFHIVPNRYLMNVDLSKLPAGTLLPSLEHGQNLVVTTAGGGPSPMRINYVRIKIPDVMHNLKIVVHSVYLPFPHLHPTAAFNGIGGAWDSTAVIGDGGMFPARNVGESVRTSGSCDALEKDGSCAVPPVPEIKATMEIDDHHSL